MLSAFAQVPMRRAFLACPLQKLRWSLAFVFWHPSRRPMTARMLWLRCSGCGAGFDAYMPRAGRPPGFCSDHCRRVAEKDYRRPSDRPRLLIAKSCVVCGKPFSTPSRRIICCGTACGHVLGKRKSDATKRANALTRLARFCEACGAPFVMHRPSGQARAGKSREGRFCSRACKGAASRKAGPQLDMFEADR